MRKNIYCRKIVQKKDMRRMVLVWMMMNHWAKKKIMIVLSDGLPACGGGYPSERDFLIQSINNIISRGIDIGAIGIISECVEEFYPIYSVVNEVNDLPLALADICKKMLRDSMRTIN